MAWSSTSICRGRLCASFACAVSPSPLQNKLHGVASTRLSSSPSTSPFLPWRSAQCSPPSFTPPLALRVTASSSGGQPAPGPGLGAQGGSPSPHPSLSSSPLLPFSASQSPAAGAAFPASGGVYAVFSPEDQLQYIGIARNLKTALSLHLRELPDLCGSAKVLPLASAGKAELVEAWQRWMQEYVDETGSLPPGNESGNKTWTTRRKPPSRPEIKLTPGRNTQLTCSIEELVDKVVKECSVVAFVKGTRTEPQCGFSHRVLSILNEHGAEYEVLNVLDEEHNPGLREAIKQYSQWPTIPQVYIGGEFVGGADVLDEMAQSGELKAALEKVKQRAPAKAGTV